MFGKTLHYWVISCLNKIKGKGLKKIEVSSLNIYGWDIKCHGDMKCKYEITYVSEMLRKAKNLVNARFSRIRFFIKTTTDATLIKIPDNVMIGSKNVRKVITQSLPQSLGLVWWRRSVVFNDTTSVCLDMIWRIEVGDAVPTFETLEREKRQKRDGIVARKTVSSTASVQIQKKIDVIALFQW